MPVKREVPCQQCGSTCLAFGDKLAGVNTVGIASVETGRQLAFQCLGCFQVYCGKCCGVAALHDATCPLCKRVVECAYPRDTGIAQRSPKPNTQAVAQVLNQLPQAERDALLAEVTAEILGKSKDAGAATTSPTVRWSRCRYWRCNKCQVLCEKKNLEAKLQQGPIQLTGQLKCPRCSEPHPAAEVYGGRYDLPRRYWDQLRDKTGKPVEVPIPEDDGPDSYGLTSTELLNPDEYHQVRSIGEAVRDQFVELRKKYKLSESLRLCAPFAAQLWTVWLGERDKWSVADQPLRLRGADLSRLVLSAAQFGKADLTSADLSGTIAREPDFSGAILTAANLRESIWVTPQFNPATKGQGADLSEATLFNFQFAGDWTDAKFVNATLVIGWVELPDLKLGGADFTDCKVSKGQVGQHLPGNPTGVERFLKLLSARQRRQVEVEDD